jgi:hypothetical protein
MRYGAAATSKGREVQLHMHMRTARVLIAATAGGLVLAAGAVPAAASARAQHHATHATAADDQYVQGGGGGGGGGVLGEQAGGTGGLPFTGMNLLLVLGAGSGLIASGIGVRAASARMRRS